MHSYVDKGNLTIQQPLSTQEENNQPEKATTGRRNFIGKSLALGALGLSGCWHAAAMASAPSAPPKKAASTLPARGNYLIKQAYIITVDPELNDLPAGDVHLKNGAIVAVGQNLQAAGATVVNGEGMIVLPGLIDTHWHMWTALLRSMAGNTKGKGYFDTTSHYGPHFLPGDMYQSTRLATTEALFSGITTVHDWSHNVRSLQHAEASLRALQESGLRARYSCGTAAGQKGTSSMNFSTLDHLHRHWPAYAAENLLSLGFAWRGIGGHPAIESEAETGKAELAKARAMKLPITIHASAGGIIGKLAEARLMGKDMQLVHATDATEQEISNMVKAGASISFSPYSELRIGYGIPPITKCLDAGATISLSVDTTTLSGNADMFAIMKIFLNLANALNKDEFSLTARQVLELATMGGAKALGIADRTGSITPGKRADIIMVSTKAPNLGLFTNPVDLVVEAVQPHNVDTVFVDGRLLKRHGKLTSVPEEQVYKEAATALANLKKRAS
ncbi:amidohydrolase family protein [Pontibacter qinzhouensis]|uniref:Amidohydrolase family protein n=1 Tax=Pontibacter qinzhouensis TaxID=2603253 RepID=A0A5C8JFP3_9BACT|nr:amidohydrolase family protein [Pontibacter qinzhouensis]TXK37090.1 amidohydrolase family protein [Pontibacter qinzhouensis]